MWGGSETNIRRFDQKEREKKTTPLSAYERGVFNQPSRHVQLTFYISAELSPTKVRPRWNFFPAFTRSSRSKKKRGRWPTESSRNGRAFSACDPDLLLSKLSSRMSFDCRRVTRFSKTTRLIIAVNISVLCANSAIDPQISFFSIVKYLLKKRKFIFGFKWSIHIESVFGIRACEKIYPHVEFEYNYWNINASDTKLGYVCDIKINIFYFKRSRNADGVSSLSRDTPIGIHRLPVSKRPWYRRWHESLITDATPEESVLTCCRCNGRERVFRWQSARPPRGRSVSRRLHIRARALNARPRRALDGSARCGTERGRGLDRGPVWPRRRIPIYR